VKILISEEEVNSYSSRQPIPFECDRCKQVFYKAKHRYQGILKKGLLPKFCSNKCANLNKIVARITINCNFCSKTLERTAKNTGKYNFCSCRCAGKFNAAQKALKTPPKTKKCKFCENPFNISGGRTGFCSKKCKKEYSFKINKKTIISCYNCQQPVERLLSKVKKHTFCSGSCQAIYANKTWNKATRFGFNKSKSETELKKIIELDFPLIGIIENDRELLNGLEVDLHIPEFKIAIELNGPVHYIPMFGEKNTHRHARKRSKKNANVTRPKIPFYCC
jgi:endogenous inhibitor of DNA gyrase (YacG/DUF329 family)